jgi:hypothetical protein
MLFQGGYLGTYETKHMLLKRRAQKRLAARGDMLVYADLRRLHEL